MPFFKKGHTPSLHPSQSNQFIPSKRAVLSNEKDTHSNQTDEIQKKNDSGSLDFFGNPSFIQPSIPIQAKLKIRKAGDKYEQEADKMADKVVKNDSKMSESVSIQKLEEEAVQNKIEEEQVQKSTEEEESIQKMPEEETVQKIEGEGDEHAQGKGIENVDEELENQISQSRGHGKPMAPDVQGSMEQNFGADFSGVQLHTDSNAAQMNQQLGSKAFANGSDIYFNGGQYQPNSKDGKHLLAHELTHVVQQGAAVQKKEETPSSRALRSLIKGKASTASNSKLFKKDIHDFQSSNTESNILRKQEMIQSETMVGDVKQTTDRSRIQRACINTGDDKEKKEAAKKAAASPKASGILVPQDNFSGRSNKRYGVGEVLNLSSTVPTSTPLPAGVGLEWKKKSGLGTIANSGANDGKGTFSCGDRAGAVELELVLTGGSIAGTVLDTKKFNVVQPSGSYMIKQPGTNVWHEKGKASIGFKGLSYLLPKDVSFNKIERREGDGKGVGSGFFKRFDGYNHPIGSWFSVASGDISKGSLVNTVDTVSTGPFDETYSTGAFTWPIKRQFRVGTSAAETFTTANHIMSIDSTGKTTIEKHGAGPYTRELNDPSKSY